MFEARMARTPCLLAAALLLGLPAASSAAPTPDDNDLSAQAQALATARAAFADGRPAETLEALKDLTDTRVADRRDVLRGEALLVLGQAEAAAEAFGAALDSQIWSVRHQARRGLLQAWSLSDHHARRLEALEQWGLSGALYRLAKVESLVRLRRHPAAVDELTVLRSRHPTAYMESVDRLTATLRSRGVKVSLTPAEAARRIEGLIGEGQLTRASRELDAHPLDPRRRRWLQAELAQRRGRHEEARRILEALHDEEPSGEGGDEVLYALARMHMRVDRYPSAQKYFDELVHRFPRSDRAEEGAFLAGWLDYDDGNYEAARRRMLAFADDRPGSEKATEALWYAGWSAYLGSEDAQALSAFDRLVKAHPGSSLVPFAHYWSGRIHARNERPEAAVAAYQATVDAAPLSYYGFWARRRLASAGSPVEAPQPDDDLPVFSVAQARTELGLGSVHVDRAVAFFDAGLEDWVEEEMKRALESLPASRSARDRVLRADLCRRLGAHRLAFRLGLAARPRLKDLKGDDAHWSWRLLRHAYPRAFEEEVRTNASEHGVSPDLVWSVIRTESHFRDDAVSPVGARGLMQMMPATARAIARQEPSARPHARRLFDPRSNTWLGSWYLAQLAFRYHDFIPAMVAAYNAGPNAADRWLNESGDLEVDAFIERISYRETRRYVRRVLETRWIYQTFEGGPRDQIPLQVKHQPAPERAVSF